jgi:hypothetical protein
MPEASGMDCTSSLIIEILYTGCGGDEGDCTEEYLREVAICYGITSRRQTYRILVVKRGGQALAIIKFVYRFRRINKHVGKLLSMFIVLLITGSGELFWVSNFWRLKTTKSRQSIEGVKAEIQC